MAMDPKQLGAFIGRAKKNTDDRSRAPLSHYESPANKRTPNEFVETVSMSEADMDTEDEMKAIEAQQAELEAQSQKAKGAPAEEEPLPEDPTDLDKLLE